MAGMAPRDLARLVAPSDPRLHPDGRRVAWVRTAIDVADDTYVREVWLWDGEESRAFTSGPKDASPRWSPDGRHLAFLRAGADDKAKPQLAVMSADGGEARILTELPLGVSDLAWAPDGGRLVVVGSSWHADVADLDDDERPKRAKRITRLGYKFDDRGFIHDRESHLWLVDVDGEAGDERCLTPGDEFSESAPAWSPDGREIAFTSVRHEDREFHPSSQVFRLDVESGSVEPVTDDRGDWWALGYDRDGGLHGIGFENVFGWPGSVGLHRLDGEDLDMVEAGDRSMGGGAPTYASGITTFDGGLMTAREDGGRQELVAVSPTGQLTVLLDGDRCVTGADISADGSVVVATVTDPTTPGELVVLRDGTESVVTSFGQDVADLVRPTERFTASHDGVEVDAWAVLPEGDGPWPVVLNIHGGPTAQYGEYFFDEFQVYAAAGYLVLGGNPRGSSGRGTDWARAVVGMWDEMRSVDMLDLLSVLDTGLERYADRVDHDRLGIMGGSYGGYATARILTFDHRFRAAIVERGLLQWESFAGTSDIGAYFDRMFLESDPVEGLDKLRDASPVLQAQDITTPTLVLHSEKDYRCPMEQAEQLFTTLRRAGTPSEFVRFPDEGHELSRSGSPRHRVERFDVVLEWLGRWLDNPWDTDSLAEVDADED